MNPAPAEALPDALWKLVDILVLNETEASMLSGIAVHGGFIPFGGRSGSDSGIGKVGGAHVMHSFTELQTIVLTPDSRRS